MMSQKKLKVLQVGVSDVEVCDGKRSCANLEVYPINQPVVWSVFVWFMASICGFKTQIMRFDNPNLDVCIFWDTTELSVNAQGLDVDPQVLPLSAGLKPLKVRPSISQA